MHITEELKERIFAKTNGRCRYCGKSLAYANYGLRDKRGSWHVDHSKAQAKGGSDDYENLWPACITCNIKKSDRSARGFRVEMKPIRVNRRNEAIERDLEDAAPPIGILGFLAVLLLGDAATKQRELEVVGSNDEAAVRKLYVQRNRSLFWAAVLIALVVLVVIFIFKSHKSI
jgi:hypothetical protein